MVILFLFIEQLHLKHGVPQNRLRTFYFFWKSETAPVLSYYDRPRKNLREYLEEIPVDAP